MSLSKEEHAKSVARNLTMLYLQKIVSTNISPTQLAEQYITTSSEILEVLKKATVIV